MWVLTGERIHAGISGFGKTAPRFYHVLGKIATGEMCVPAKSYPLEIIASSAGGASHDR